MAKHGTVLDPLKSTNMSSPRSVYLYPINQSSSSTSQILPKLRIVEDETDNDDPTVQVTPPERFNSKRKSEEICFKQNKKISLDNSYKQSSLGTNCDQNLPLQSGLLCPDSKRHTPNSAFQSRDDSSSRNWRDFGLQDWNVNLPSQRVGYEDMTAIDWIFEYTKERQRLSLLYLNSKGFIGYVKHLFDSSQVWIVLISTGLAAGIIAAGIDITSDWLGDIKTGYCSSSQDGGQFYLNKNFCCFGFDGLTQCKDWIPWNTAFNIHSAKASWLTGYIFFILLTILFALTASFLVKEYALFAKHSGLPEIKTILGGFVIRRFMGIWTLIVKSLGLCLAVASGMWLGKEGPLVHVACCCAHIFMKFFNIINYNEARKREVLSAAAAAGISVAFGSPIGGVLFSLEQLSYYFPDKTMWQSFVCAMTAAVTLQATDPFRSGKLVRYQVTYSRGWHGFEMIPFVILGIFGGIYGGLFIKLNMKVAEWKKKKSKWLPGPTVQVVIVAFVTAIINFPNLYMRARSSELLYFLFAECSKVMDDQLGLCQTGSATTRTVVLLILAATLGFFLASITFGLQIPSGVLLPSMVIGALFGRAIGIMMEIWIKSSPYYFLFANCEPDEPCVTPGTYAIVGAAAALGGVTRMNVSIVVIMFELTGALTYVLPIMIAVMLSKWIGDAFGKRGIYESWINFYEYPFLENNEETFIPDIPVGEIMTCFNNLVVLTATGQTIKSLLNILELHPYRGFPVISDIKNPILLGYISRAELSHNLHLSQERSHHLPLDTEVLFSYHPNADLDKVLDLRPWMDQAPLTLPSHSNLLLTVTYFQKLGLRYVLFTYKGVLQGLLTKKDVWNLLNGYEKTRNVMSPDEIGDNLELTRNLSDGEGRSLLYHPEVGSIPRPTSPRVYTGSRL